MHDIKITITGTSECPDCRGDRIVWPSRAAEKRGDESEMITCPYCGGKGTTTDSQEITLAEFRDLMNAMESED